MAGWPRLVPPKQRSRPGCPAQTQVPGFRSGRRPTAPTQCVARSVSAAAEHQRARISQVSARLPVDARRQGCIMVRTIVVGGPRVKKLSDYMTVGGAASYLGVSKDTLRRWDATGRLRARRHPVTGFRLYLSEDLDAVLVDALQLNTATSGRRE